MPTHYLYKGTTFCFWMQTLAFMAKPAMHKTEHTAMIA